MQDDRAARESAWKEAWRLWSDREPGPHISSEELEGYVRGSIASDPKKVVDVRRHLARCEECLRREIVLRQGARILEFEPRRLKVLGWETAGAAARLAAGHEGPSTYESLREGESRADLQVSPSEELFVTVTERGEALVGWLVRLERVDADGAVLADERSETTDVRGRASLGALQTLRPLEAHQRFSVVVVGPGE